MSICDALISSGPHEGIPVEDRLFAPFIGGWSLEVTWHERGAPIRRERGEWFFDWVLEGRAVQDVWIVPPREERRGGGDLYEYGTSLRFYDPTIRAWRSTWIGPMHGIVRTFVARAVGDTIMLETDPGRGDRLRWIFSNIAEHGFVWRNLVERGDRWELQQDFQATRLV